MIYVAGYCRVSTDKEDQINSFEAQQRYFQEYIKRQPEWELYEIYADDGVTGTSIKKRIHFNRMIQDAHKGRFQVIVTKEVSRFSRNILDAISFTRELKSIGVEVLFLNDGISTMAQDAELRLSIMATIAQEESRKTSSRVVWGQTRQMERGVVFGRSLLGYDVKNGKITVNPEGAEIVHLIFQKYAVEQVGTSNIARFLTEKGYHTHSGKTKWTSAAVVRIIKNEKYAGDLIQKKTYTPNYLTHEKQKNKGAVPLICIENHHEPIISREVWHMAQKRLRQNNKHGKGSTGHSNSYIFSGKIKCGECGASFVGRFKYLNDGKKVRRWSCGTAVRNGTASCNIGKLIRDDDAMQMLKTAVKSLSADTKAIIQNVTELALSAIQADETESIRSFSRIRSEIDRLQKKKEAVMDSYFSGEISRDDMQTMKEKYEVQIAVFRQQLASSAHMEKEDPQVLKKTIESELNAILTGERESDGFYKNLLHSLTVFKDRHIELRLTHLDQVFHFIG